MKIINLTSTRNAQQKSANATNKCIDKLVDNIRIEHPVLISIHFLNNNKYKVHLFGILEITPISKNTHLGFQASHLSQK